MRAVDENSLLGHSVHVVVLLLRPKFINHVRNFFFFCGLRRARVPVVLFLGERYENKFTTGARFDLANDYFF